MISIDKLKIVKSSYSGIDDVDCGDTRCKDCPISRKNYTKEGLSGFCVDRLKEYYKKPRTRVLTLSELELWRKEFPHMISYIKAVKKAQGVLR